MRRAFQFLLLVLLSCTVRAEDGSAWRDLGTTRGVSLSERKVPETGLTEYQARSVIDTPVAAVRAVLRDVDGSASFMPYVAEVKVLRRSADSVLFYQRIKPPFVSERDYTLLFTETRLDTPQGTGWRLGWRTANEEGPPATKGIVRVPVNFGRWELTPAEDGAKTELRYFVTIDIGDSVPAFLAEKGNRMALPKIIEAVRQQVR